MTNEWKHLLENCKLCPVECGANRLENAGACGVSGLHIAKFYLHPFEEPIISGSRGSGTVFFCGCSLKCVFCQNFELSRNMRGKVISPIELADIFKQLEDMGAHNINLVTPTHYVEAIKRALDIYRPKIPIVYNSGGYEKKETIAALEGYIDIFLIDFKYISPEKALLYSNAKDYPSYAEAFISEAYRRQEKCVFKDGIMQKGVIIRHLLMPSSTKEAIQIFDWVRENTPNAYFSFMSQYVPFAEALNMPVINRRVTEREYEKVLDYIIDSGFSNVYIQETDSADTKYIPSFEGEIK